MKEKILTQKIVHKLGWDKVEHITDDMLDSYTSIGDFAFSYCTSLASIEIPNSITHIGDYAFFDCIGLTSVIIPNSVTGIGICAFRNCSSLTSITIPNSITSIGNYAFYGCTGLTSVTISSSVTSIGRSAFYGCSSLTSVTIGDVKYESQQVINGKCKAYKAFNEDMICRDFHYEEGKTYKISGKPQLCERGFHACLNLIDVFNYYYGKLGKDIQIHEVELEGISEERRGDSKIAGNKITVGTRIV